MSDPLVQPPAEDAQLQSDLITQVVLFIRVAVLVLHDGQDSGSRVVVLTARSNILSAETCIHQLEVHMGNALRIRFLALFTQQDTHEPPELGSAQSAR